MFVVLLLASPQMTAGQRPCQRLVPAGDCVEELGMLGRDDREVIVLTQLPAHP